MFYTSTYKADILEEAGVMGVDEFGVGSRAISADLERFSTMKFNLSILEDSDFRSLQTLGDVNVDPGITGRSNIFAPY